MRLEVRFAARIAAAVAAAAEEDDGEFELGSGVVVVFEVRVEAVDVEVVAGILANFPRGGAFVWAAREANLPPGRDAAVGAIVQT